MYRDGNLLAGLFCALLFGACQHAPSRKTARPVYDEAALKAFVLHLPANAQNAGVMLDSILQAANKDSAVFHQTTDFLDKPLGDPNSAYRDEDLYIRLLKARLQSPWYTSPEKTLVQKRLQLILQNRPGNLANDFAYICVDGSRKRLYDLQSNYILLLFYNPECPACKDMKEAIAASSIINDAIKAGRLMVLAVYTETDLSAWRNHLADMPAHWIVAHDDNGCLYSNGVYNLKAIPTLYLLNRNKKVLMKDVLSVPLIEQQLKRPA